MAFDDLTSNIDARLDTEHPLWPIKAKISRAERHLDVLGQKIRSFLHGEPYDLSHESDDETGQHIWRVKIREFPDPRWGLLVSEIVHHLHSALDHIAWVVAERESGEPPSGTGFPIYGSRRSFRRTWTRSGGYYQIRGMPPHAQAIIEDEQPYHRGHANEAHDLWVLRALSNTDKHQALMVVGGAAGKGHVKVTQEGGEVPVKPVKFINGPFKDSGVIARWPLPATGTKGMTIQLEVGFSFHIAFPRSGPAKGREVMQALVDMRNTVNRIVARLVPFAE